jgi:hypothetical protein
MQVDGSPSVLHSCHRVWWLMWLPPCRRTGVDPAEAARATWGWQHGSWPVSMSNTASDAVSRAGARMTAWCSGPPSAPTELGKNDGEECRRRPGRRGDTRASGHEGPPRAHGEDGCAGIAARPVLRGRDPPVRMRRTRRRCTRCRCIGKVDELVVDGVGEEVRQLGVTGPRCEASSGTNRRCCFALCCQQGIS